MSFDLYRKEVQTWRQQFNPLRALTVRKVVSWLEQAEYGYKAELMWLFRFIEKRDATLRALVARRTSAVKRLDWTVEIKEEQAEADGKLDVALAQKELLKKTYDGIDNLKRAVAWLCMATFRGYAHLEKHYDDPDDPQRVTHLEEVPQWFMCKRWPSNDWQFNPKADMTNYGIPIDPQRWVTREIDAPVDEIAALAFVRKNLSKKDWDGFLETYGVPPLFIIMPEKMSTSTDFQAIAEKVIGDSRGCLPFGSEVKNVETALHGRFPFREHLDYCNEEVVLAGTGGKLTMLNDPTGLGSGQSEVHQDTFDELAEAEGEEISEIFQEHFDKPCLRQKFPLEEEYAFFKLQTQKKDDVTKVVQQIAQLKTAGYKVPVEQASEKTGFDLEETMQATPFGQQSFGGQPGEEQPFRQEEQSFGGEEFPPEGEAAGEVPIDFESEEPVEEEGFSGQEGEEEQRKAKLLRHRRLLNRRARKLRLRNAKTQDQRIVEAVAEAQARDLRGVLNRLEEISLIQDLDLRNVKLREFKAQLPSMLRDLNRDPASAHVLQRALAAQFKAGVEKGT